jgi:hypothetical protein
MKITLGSMSTHKLNAVRQACQELGLDAVVLGVKTQSGQNEQPVGFDETFGGALNRATSAMSKTPTASQSESKVEFSTSASLSILQLLSSSHPTTDELSQLLKELSSPRNMWK